MGSEAFTSVLLSGHKGNAAQVPFDPKARWSVAAQQLWPGRRGFLVRATLNGVPFESAVVARSRKFWLLVPNEVSEPAKVSVGQSGKFTVAPNNSIQRTRYARR